MKRENFNYLVVGIFVLAIMIFTIVLMYKLAMPNEEMSDYYSEYESITGIKAGSKVTHGGYQIGSVVGVTRVSKDGSTQFRLQLRVKKNWKIPKDGVAQIVAPNFLSVQLIDIIEPPVAKKASMSLKARKAIGFFKPGDTIPGKKEVSFMTMMNDIAAEVQDLSDSKIKPILTNLNRHIDKIGTRLAEQIPQMAENTNKLLISLNQGADQLNKILGSENRTYIKNILRNADKMSAKMLEMTSKLDQVRAKLASVMTNVDQILTKNKPNVDRIVKSARKTLAAISARITTIVHNIEQTSRNMSEFTYKLRKNPGLIIRNKKATEQGIYTK